MHHTPLISTIVHKMRVRIDMRGRHVRIEQQVAA